MKVGRFERNHRLDSASGFSILELMLVVVIILILMAIAVPAAINMVHTFRLHNATTEFTSIVQQARIRSVKDSNFYPVRYKDTKPITEAYVDITKNSVPDITCTTTTNCDPLVSWSDEVTPQSHSTATDKSVDVDGLKTLVLAGTSSGGVVFLDGYDIGSTPITFSPMGIPCVPTAWDATGYCNTASTNAKENAVVAYYMFFENTVTEKWEAVTITPAGKIQKWQYSGTKWVQL